MVTGTLVASSLLPPGSCLQYLSRKRVQQSHCLSIFHRALLSRALALSASQFVHKKKSQRIYTSMHLAGLEHTKLTYTRLGDNLIRHRGDRYIFFFFAHFYFPGSGQKPWSQVSFLLPPGSCLQFLSRIGFSSPTARRFFIECCKLTLSRFPQVNLCTRKSPHEFRLYE